MFWWYIEEKIKNISWKKVLWNREYLSIYYDSKEFKYITDINIWKNQNYISKDFLINILKYPTEKIKDNIVKFKMSLLWESRIAKFNISEELKKTKIFGWSI